MVVVETSESVPVHGKSPGRRERKKLDTRRRIFRAAFDLFSEKGFDATTVEEIAEHADVGKGTVFNYFPHKTAFLVAAYREWVGVMQEDLGPVASWEGSAREQLGRVVDLLTDLAVEHGKLARQVIFEHMRQAHLRMTMENEAAGRAGSPEARDSVDASMEPETVRVLEDMAREVICQGKAKGDIRPWVDEEQGGSLIAAAAFHTLVRGLVRSSSADEIKSALASKLDIIFTGLTP
jgi:AcrR family transcriptional regulator